MKHYIFGVLLIASGVAILFFSSGCSNESNRAQSSLVDQTTFREISLKVIEGHKYLVAEKSEAISIIHAESCFCKGK